MLENVEFGRSLLYLARSLEAGVLENPKNDLFAPIKNYEQRRECITFLPLRLRGLLVALVV